MRLDDLENIVTKVSMDFFNHKHPDFNAVDNPKSVQSCIDDTAFIINKFISYFNKLAEEQLNDGR